MSPKKIAPNAPKTIDNRTLLENIPPEQQQKREAFIGQTQRDVVAMMWDYPSGYHLNWHTHSRHQLLYPSTGVITVITETSVWVVTPDKALWIPSGTRHAVKTSGSVEMRSLFLNPFVLPNEIQTCGLVNISPMLREMLRHVVNLPTGYDCEGPDGRLINVILEQIDLSPDRRIKLPKPEDPFLIKMEQHLLNHPDDSRSLEDWAKELGASSRTLARRIKDDIHISFRDWRLKLRLLAAIEHLAAGQPVAYTAHAVGFSSESAFIDRFKKATGLTPGRYFKMTNDSQRDI